MRFCIGNFQTKSKPEPRPKAAAKPVEKARVEKKAPEKKLPEKKALGESSANSATSTSGISLISPIVQHCDV